LLLLAEAVALANDLDFKYPFLEAARLRTYDSRFAATWCLSQSNKYQKLLKNRKENVSVNDYGDILPYREVAFQMPNRHAAVGNLALATASKSPSFNPKVSTTV
jgi:hypothetical protein